MNGLTSEKPLLKWRKIREWRSAQFRVGEDFRSTWKALTKAAGVPGLLVHDMRRSAVRRGVSKHVAKRISGHKTDCVFDRYDTVDESDLAEAARKLSSNAELDGMPIYQRFTSNNASTVANLMRWPVRAK